MNDETLFNYNQVYQQLQTLLKQIEQDQVQIDELDKQVSTAFNLLDSLKKRLNDIDLKVEAIIQSRYSDQPKDFNDN